MFDLKIGFIVTVVLLACSAVRSDATDFDVLTLSQSWPQTSCWDLNELWTEAATTKCSSCQMPKDKQSWTIHGLWPSKLQGKHPAFCSTKPKFNAKLFNDELRAELEQKWPSYNLKMTYEAFWGYEWKKHGTCALDVLSTSTIPKYFNKSVQLLDSYNVGKILASSGIVPGKKYQYKDVISVLENTLKVNVYVKCAVNSVSKEQYLNEISMCFDKSFKLTNCNIGDSTTNCKSKDVEYPANLNSC